MPVAVPVADLPVQPFVAHELGAGLLASAVAEGPVDPSDRGAAAPGGEVVWRHESAWWGSGERSMGEGRVQLVTGPDGVTQLSRLELSGMPLTLRIRPRLGDAFDLSILGGSADQVWTGADTRRGFWRFYTPITLTALGISNTDYDADRKVKAYVQAGLGAGGELQVGVVGPVGLYLRAEGEARSLNRHQGDARNQVRHEVLGELVGGVSLGWPSVSLRMVAWGELVSQWETRDADGASGVDRQLQAMGARLVVRLVPDPVEAPRPRRKPPVDGVAAVAAPGERPAG
jgi:hypothetical protein